MEHWRQKETLQNFYLTQHKIIVQINILLKEGIVKRLLFSVGLQEKLWISQFVLKSFSHVSLI
jgi:hypothetical protein